MKSTVTWSDCVLRSTLYRQASKPPYIFINRFATPKPPFFSFFLFPENANIAPFGIHPSSFFHSYLHVFPAIPLLQCVCHSAAFDNAARSFHTQGGGGVVVKSMYPPPPPTTAVSFAYSFNSIHPHHAIKQ